MTELQGHGTLCSRESGSCKGSQLLYGGCLRFSTKAESFHYFQENFWVYATNGVKQAERGQFYLAYPDTGERRSMRRQATAQVLGPPCL